MIVLDTNVFLRMHLEQDKLTKAMLDNINSAKILGIAAITLWEIAMLVQYNRVQIPDPSILSWFQIVLKAPKLRILPLTPEIAARTTTLEMHGDPADRLIAATALHHGCRLATFDELLIELEGLETIC